MESVWAFIRREELTKVLFKAVRRSVMRTSSSFAGCKFPDRSALHAKPRFTRGEKKGKATPPPSSCSSWS